MNNCPTSLHWLPCFASYFHTFLALSSCRLDGLFFLYICLSLSLFTISVLPLNPASSLCRFCSGKVNKVNYNFTLYNYFPFCVICKKPFNSVSLSKCTIKAVLEKSNLPENQGKQKVFHIFLTNAFHLIPPL